MAGSSLEMSIDETVSYLQRSFIPTLLVEGSGDRAALRDLERKVGIRELDILPIFGKLRLHDVYCRKSEFSDRRIVFLRDRDEYIAYQSPEGMSDYVFTNGYSIENDILDVDVIKKLSGDKFSEIMRRVELMAAWFRHSLQRYATDRNMQLSADVSCVLRGDGYSEEAAAQMAAVDLVPPCSQLDLTECWCWLRGKTLLRAIHSVFCELDVKYSKAQLLNICTCFGPSLAFKSLVDRIRKAFQQFETKEGATGIS